MSLIVVKLDKKDVRILSCLDFNSRQTNSKIAKQVGLSKDSVGYRIKSLEDRGIIRGYNAVIDSSKLGYLLYRICFNLMDINNKELVRLIEFLKKEKNVWWIASVDGQWDLLFAIWVKTNKEFNEFYLRFNKEFRKYVKHKLICPIISYERLSRGEERKKEVVGMGELEKYDVLDFEILKVLSKNARVSLLDLAGRFRVDSMTIKHRIKKLEKKQIIKGYKLDLDLGVMKKEVYSVKINVNAMNQLKQLKEYVQTFVNVVGITEAIGGYDFEFDLEVESSEEYFSFINKLKERFNTIREIVYYRLKKSYKTLYMPEQ